MAINFEELVCVVCHNTSLIWLCNIGKNDVDSRQEYAVFLRKASILDNGCMRVNVKLSNKLGMQNARMTFVRFLAMLIRSRPDRGENSTAYTMPSLSRENG